MCQTTSLDHLNGHHLVFPPKGYNNTEGCVHLRDAVVFTMWLISRIKKRVISSLHKETNVTWIGFRNGCRIIVELRRYSTWNIKKTTISSDHYLHNRSSMDIGVLGLSVYFNLRNTLPKFGTFLLGHPAYHEASVIQNVICTNSRQ